MAKQLSCRVVPCRARFVWNRAVSGMHEIQNEQDLFGRFKRLLGQKIWTL